MRVWFVWIVWFYFFSIVLDVEEMSYEILEVLLLSA